MRSDAVVDLKSVLIGGDRNEVKSLVWTVSWEELELFLCLLQIYCYHWLYKILYRLPWQVQWFQFFRVFSPFLSFFCFEQLFLKIHSVDNGFQNNCSPTNNQRADMTEFSPPDGIHTKLPQYFWSYSIKY